MAQVSMTALEPHLASTRVPVYNGCRKALQRVRQIPEEHMKSRAR